MEFKILKIKEEISKWGGHKVFAVFFKGSDGKSYRTWLDPKNANYGHWSELLKEGNVLSNLVIKGGSLINADSFPIKEKSNGK